MKKSLVALFGLTLLAGVMFTGTGYQDPQPCPPGKQCRPAPIKKPAPKPKK